MGLMVICNDVRTDTLLLGFSACAVWQIAEYLEYQRWKNLWAGFLFVGLTMLAKGPIGLVATGFAVGSHLLLRRDWRNIFRWQWLPGLAITALVLAPMCWGLWQQFDLHPEKTGQRPVWRFRIAVLFLGTEFRPYYRRKCVEKRRFCVLFPARVPLGFFTLVSVAPFGFVATYSSPFFQKFGRAAGMVFPGRLSAHFCRPFDVAV